MENKHFEEFLKHIPAEIKIPINPREEIEEVKSFQEFIGLEMIFKNCLLSIESFKKYAFDISLLKITKHGSAYALCHIKEVFPGRFVLAPILSKNRQV